MENLAFVRSASRDGCAGCFLVRLGSHDSSGVAEHDDFQLVRRRERSRKDRPEQGVANGCGLAGHTNEVRGSGFDSNQAGVRAIARPRAELDFKKSGALRHR